MSVVVGLELGVEQRDLLAERLELGQDEVVAEDLGDERQVAAQHVLELVRVHGDALQRAVRLRPQLVEARHDLGQARVGVRADAGLPDLLRTGNITIKRERDTITVKNEVL